MNIKDIKTEAKNKIDEKGNFIINKSDGSKEVVNVVREDFKSSEYITERYNKVYKDLGKIIEELKGSIQEEGLSIVNVT